MATTDCIVTIDLLTKELESLGRPASHGTIPRVPDFLMKGKEDDYTPRLVSIGPYHSRNEKLAETNKVKLLFLQNLVNRSPESNSVKKYFDAVRSHADCAKEKYSGDGIGQNLDELATMMVIDGCFIIELFLERLPDDGHRRTIRPNISRKDLAFLHTDVLLVENQIPFNVLEELFEASHIPELESHLKKVRKGNSNSPPTFAQLALAYFEHDQLIGASAVKFYSEKDYTSFEFDHLLHLYHSIWDPSFKGRQRSNFSDAQERPSHAHPQEEQGQPTTTTCSCKQCLLLFLLCWAIALYWLVSTLWNYLKNLVSFLWKWLKKLVRFLFFLLHLAVSYIINRREGKESPSLQSRGQPKLDAPLGIPNASLLRDMGFEFKKNVNPKNWLDISLTDGVLRIPVLPINQRTIIVFRNIVAFEELDSRGIKNFTAFATLMDMLIDTEKDVAILRKCGIIESQLDKDQEVADFFNNLCNGTCLVSDGPGRVTLLDDLKNYYEEHHFDVMLHQWRETLIPDSLRSPWAIPAIIVGVILLLPSALQTFNTIYSMFNPPSQQNQLISVY